MKILLTVLLGSILVAAFSSTGNAQTYLDTANFTIAAQIKPSDYAVWNDSVAAWRVYATYDIDKDGKKEFLVIVDPASTQPADTTMPSILQFEASGNNKFDLVWSVQIPYQNTSKGSWPCLTVADVDKDGQQEIIFGLPSEARLVGDPNPTRLFIYEYDSVAKKLPNEPTLTSKLSFPDKYYYAITSILADDVDKDGDVELILSARRAYGGGSGTASTRPLIIYHLNGDISPGFSDFEREFVDSIGTFNGGYYFNNDIVDFDGNGKKEIWGYTWDMISYGVYEATAKDTYVLKTDVNQVTPDIDYGEQNSVGFFDANKDGKLEMFFAGRVDGLSQSIVLYLPNTNDLTSLNVSSQKTIIPAFTTGDFQGASIGDIDGNGEVDFAIAARGTSRMAYVVKHISGKPFDDSTGYKLDTLYSAPKDSTYDFRNVLITNDIDNDGKRELFIVNTNTRNNHPEDVSIIILESKVVVTNVKHISTVTPTEFTLDQNFPNPFNPSSTIRFALKTEGRIELFITNALGQRVASLVDGKFAAGKHEVTFNADGLASGTYFYTLKSGNMLETKKMTLLK
ncbi:MAG: T9SS type A sorting domain-containing protein [Bacteroidota bacterium]